MDENPYKSPAAIPSRRPDAFRLGRLLWICTASGFGIGAGLGFIVGYDQLLIGRLNPILWAPVGVGGIFGLLFGAVLAAMVCLVVLAARLLRTLLSTLQAMLEGRAAVG